jgi:hypothetical protein
MESSPSKRRKTSPTTSVPIDAPTTPSRIPVRKDGAKTTPGRPSFASPTKASLARHNPQLLREPASSARTAAGSRGRNLDDIFARALGEAQPSIERNDGAGEEGTEDSTTQENEIPEEGRSLNTRSFRGGLSAKPRRMSRSPFKPFKPFETMVAAVEQQNINPFQKTGLRRSPIALPQEEPVSQEAANPFQKRGLRRSPISSQPIEVPRPGSVPVEVSTTPKEAVPARPLLSDPLPHNEPELLQQPIPKSSLLKDIYPVLSSPSRRPRISQPSEISGSPRRPRVSKELETSSPPPRPKPARETRPSQVVQLPSVSFGPRRSQLSFPSPQQLVRVIGAAVPNPLSESTDHEEPELPPTPVQRGVPDPKVTTPPTGIHDTPSRRARRNKALGEKLKSSPLKPRDLAPDAESGDKPVVKEPVNRRKSARFTISEDLHASKKAARDEMLEELHRLQADVSLVKQENEQLRLHYESNRGPPNSSQFQDKLAALLVRSIASEHIAEPPPKPKSIFQSIGSFLPFSSRRKASPPPPVPDKSIPSHLPVAVKDPLPYLQAFSPLTYTSSIMLLPSEQPNSSSEISEDLVMQRHLINVSYPSGLFSARLSMDVDSSLLSVSSLSIQKLDPCAEKELGLFIRERCRENATLCKDIGVVCWAMGRWVEVSILRARLWCTITNEFGNAEARAKALQQIKKRKRNTILDEDDEDNEPSDDRKKVTRSQLLPFMGRSAVEIASEDVELRFEWKITFDWTGEVESTISASARIPNSCELILLLSE